MIIRTRNLRTSAVAWIHETWYRDVPKLIHEDTGLNATTAKAAKDLQVRIINKVPCLMQWLDENIVDLSSINTAVTYRERNLEFMALLL